jgi:hypothetical protein
MGLNDLYLQLDLFNEPKQLNFMIGLHDPSILAGGKSSPLKM